MKVTGSRHKTPTVDNRSLYVGTDSIGYHGGTRFQSLPVHAQYKPIYNPVSVLPVDQDDESGDFTDEKGTSGTEKLQDVKI